MRTTRKQKPPDHNSSQEPVPIGDVEGEEMPNSDIKHATRQHPTLPVGND